MSSDKASRTKVTSNTAISGATHHLHNLHLMCSFCTCLFHLVNSQLWSRNLFISVWIASCIKNVFRNKITLIFCFFFFCVTYTQVHSSNDVKNHKQQWVNDVAWPTSRLDYSTNVHFELIIKLWQSWYTHWVASLLGSVKGHATKLHHHN